MLAVACGGLLVNGVGLWLLRGGREGNLNVRGAWLHLLTDALGSVQAIVAGALIWAFAWYSVDPFAFVLIGLLVFTGQFVFLFFAPMWTLLGSVHARDTSCTTCVARMFPRSERVITTLPVRSVPFLTIFVSMLPPT